jgi:hypothetical protein
MSIQLFSNDLNDPEFGPVRFPETDERRARAAVFEENGEAAYVGMQLGRFDALNPTVGARAVAAALGRESAALTKAYRRQTRRLGRTDESILTVSAERDGSRPLLRVLEPVVLALASAFALFLSNFVLANYIVRSGADLYAADPGGARLFAATAILAAFGIKVFERKLDSDGARRWYANIFFALGIGSFLLWAGMAAVAFAPDLSGSAAWLAVAGNNTNPTIVLIFSHLMGDIAWGYLLFSGAEELALANYKRVERPNPQYARLDMAATVLAARIERVRRRMAKAEDYLASVAAGREATRAAAVLDFVRAYRLCDQGRAMAEAYARSTFLNV